MTLEEMIPLLGIRTDGFKIMIDHLMQIQSPLIVETGCARQENNFNGDGMSTLIWDRVVDRTNGEAHSVDINPLSVNFARSKVGPRTKVHCADSVNWLQQAENELIGMNRRIDLLYLDSFDLDDQNPHPSSLHHIFELLSIKSALRPGTLVAVDDNGMVNGVPTGKGTYVAQWMATNNKRFVYQGYQWIWEW